MKDGIIQACVINDHLPLPAPNENGRGGLKAVALSLKAPSFLFAIIRLQMGNVAYREFSTNEFERRTRELLFLKLSTVFFISSSSSCCRLLPASFFLSFCLSALGLGPRLGPQVISPSLLDFTNSPNTNSGRKTKEGKYCQKCNLINPEALSQSSENHQ